MRKSLFVCSNFLFVLLAGGYPAEAVVNLSATRVVFNKGEANASISLVNDADYPVMVQAWIDNGEPQGSPQTANTAFVVLPPIFRLAPREQRTLRLLSSGKGLAQDRESLYWLNVYEVPPTMPVQSHPLQSGEKVVLAFRTQLKVLWRPPEVEKLSKEDGDKLQFKLSGKTWRVVNPGPRNISLSEVTLAEYSVSGIMIKPYSEQPLFTINHAVLPSSEIKFTVINDEGNQWGYTWRRR